MSDKKKKTPPPKPEPTKVRTVKEGAFGSSDRDTSKMIDSDKK